MGIINPVKITNARMNNEAGVIVSEIVLEKAPMVLKIFDITNVVENEINKKIKNASASRFKFDKKYRTTFKKMAVSILVGKSHYIETHASADG